MDNFEKLYNRAIRFLSFRPRSEKEIKDYLLKKKVDELLIKKIIIKLREQNFLNDKDFTDWWIEQRTKIKPRAKKLIKFELKQKGINETLIQNSELKIQDDLKSAKRLIQKKILKYKELPKQEIYQKLGRFLSLKGFDWTVIKKSIDEILAENV